MLNRPKNQKYFCEIVAIPNVLRAPSLRSYFMQNGHFVVLNTSADDYSHSLRKKSRQKLKDLKSVVVYGSLVQHFFYYGGGVLYGRILTPRFYNNSLISIL